MTTEDPKPTVPEAALPAATDSPAPTEPQAESEIPAAAEAPAGPPPDEAALINALKEVVDPELMINIVDLGLVYAVRQNDTQVDVDMTLTSPACPAGPQILQQSKMALEKLSGVTTANIKLVMTPPWSPDRMTDEARDQLGIF